MIGDLEYALGVASLRICSSGSTRTGSTPLEQTGRASRTSAQSRVASMRRVHGELV